MEEIKEKQIHQGRNIGIRRNHKGLSQEALSMMLKIDPRKLSAIEKQPIVEDSVLNQIAEKLDTDINWFKTYDPDSIPCYVFTIDTNTNNDSPMANANLQKGDITYINNPVDDLMKVTDKALAIQEASHKKEIELMNANFALKLENELLKQKVKND